MTCGIYKIQNKINDKVYIGQSQKIEQRWSRHRNAQDECSIHKAIQKYGLDNFDFSIIEECPPEKLDEREIYWINQYDSYRAGYNETLGGGGSSRPVSLELNDVEEITKLLKTSAYTNIEIAEKYSISENVISGINTGYYWKRPNIDYPIRKQKRRELNFCAICGTSISFGSTYCVKCAGKQRRLIERPDKETLYNILIQNNGNFTQVGRQYGVTDNTIRRWCKSYELPSKSGDYKEEQKTSTSITFTPITYSVQQIDPKTNKVIKIFDSLSQAEKMTGIYHIREASDEKNSHRKTAGGYIWKRL